MNPRLLRGDRSAVILRINRTHSLDISGENALPGHDFPQIIDESAARFKENVYLCTRNPINNEDMATTTKSSSRSYTPNEMGHTVRKVVEVTDTPLDLVAGRTVIRRVEKILMPNGRYRYPVTYIDKTPGFWLGSVIEESERKAKELDINYRP